MDKNVLQELLNKKMFYFSKTLRWALFLFAICLTALYWNLGHYTETDKIAYEKLMRGEIQEKNETKVSKQRRTGVQKNIYFHDNNQRLALRLTSSYSELALEKNDRHVEIVECLQNVTCWLQESVYFVLPDGRQALPQSDGRLLIKGADPKEFSSWILNKEGLTEEQIVFLLKADNGTYSYKDQRFIAKNVRVFRYSVPDHHFEEISPHAHLIADGIASKVEFSLAGRGLDVKLDHFKANVFVKLGMR